MGTKRRRREAEVLDAAANVFYERGYASSTIEDVADALGMLKGSLYYYIRTKEDLLYRLISEIHEGVDGVLEGVRDAEGLSAAERLDLYVRRVVAYNAENVKRVTIYYHDIDQLSDPSRTDILAKRRAHEEYITSLIQRAQAAGDADRSADPKLLANCVFATIMWIYRWYRPGGGVSVDELAETCARFTRYGLRGGDGTPMTDGVPLSA
jgi:AcrR family transcriptional regulator